MEHALEAFAFLHGGKLEHERSSQWRGTSFVQFGEYHLHIPTAEGVVKMKVTSRQGHSRFPDMLFVHTEILTHHHSRFTGRASKAWWWHRIRTSVIPPTFRTGHRELDRRYRFRTSDKATWLRVFRNPSFSEKWLYLSPVTMTARPVNGRTALLLISHHRGVEMEGPENDLELLRDAALLVSGSPP